MEFVICELKSVYQMNPVWEAQILSHLKLNGKRLGFIVNFNLPLIKAASRELYYNLSALVAELL